MRGFNKRRKTETPLLAPTRVPPKDALNNGWLWKQMPGGLGSVFCI